MATPAPARLFFLFARAAPMAVVFRRGPTRWVQVIRWNTANDVFEPGQWFHGRIYERRCDLSPSGHLMVYFASNQTWEQQRSEYTASWTAVSKPPWLTALALWPKGDCWAGGGLFADDHTLLLNQGDVPHPKHNPRGQLRVVVQHLKGEDSPLFNQRLLRDGWVQEDPGTWHDYKSADPPETWSRCQPGGSSRIVRRVRGFFRQDGGVNRTSDELLALRSPEGIELPLPDVEWADWDPQGRLALAKAGKIVTATVNENGSLSERVLADFNAARPNPVASPPSARTW